MLRVAQGEKLLKELAIQCPSAGEVQRAVPWGLCGDGGGGGAVGVGVAVGGGGGLRLGAGFRRVGGVGKLLFFFWGGWVRGLEVWRVGGNYVPVIQLMVGPS